MASSRATVAVTDPSVPTTIVRYPMRSPLATLRDGERAVHLRGVDVTPEVVRPRREGRHVVGLGGGAAERGAHEQLGGGRGVRVDRDVVRDSRILVVEHDRERPR